MKRFSIRPAGFKGEVLLFLAFLDLVFAYGLWQPTARATATPTYVFLAQIRSLDFWAFVWALAGVLCLVFAYRRDHTIGFVAAVAVKLFWALIFLLGWLFAGVERGFISTAIWGSFSYVLIRIAGLTIMEKR